MSASWKLTLTSQVPAGPPKDSDEVRHFARVWKIK